jgi:hypothetical protein
MDLMGIDCGNTRWIELSHSYPVMDLSIGSIDLLVSVTRLSLWSVTIFCQEYNSSLKIWK